MTLSKCHNFGKFCKNLPNLQNISERVLEKDFLVLLSLSESYLDQIFRVERDFEFCFSEKKNNR